jgi:protein-S-isoprenylcysteine O-methyltransferase Ste14
MIAVRVLIFVLLPAVTLFASAGRLDLPFFWAYVGLMATAAVAMLAFIDRDLLCERIKPGPGGEDRNLRWVAMPFLIGQWVIAGLDAGRFHWSDTVPIPLRVAGLALLVIAFSLSVWAMHVNRFFSPVVRIQAERNHHVVTGGPYAWIRHPGYLAAILHAMGTLALGSWWAMCVMACVPFLLGRRITVEDRFLRAQLAGYADYAARVRYRLIPGVW